jgi:lipopolysaccharide transport system ATP-binding protein
MYLRLAFAVAAHMEPEILLVDEVLAVGDAAFQRRCLGKMQDISRHGRTILFVSHNMSAITTLCQRGIVLDGGRVVREGRPAECIASYLENLRLEDASAPSAGRGVGIGHPEIRGGDGGRVMVGGPLSASLPVTSRDAVGARFNFLVEDFAGQILVNAKVDSRDIAPGGLGGRVVVEVDLPPMWLAPGVYSAYFKASLASLGAGSSKLRSEKVAFEVHGGEELEEVLGTTTKSASVLSPRCAWRVRGVTAEPARAVRRA